jgi:hypothetical protein
MMLLLKLTLAPVLIGLVSLAQRKWGAAISGALVGLPLTSGPVLFFLAIEQGATFSAHTAIGSLLGLIAQAGFALAYSRLANWRGWAPSVAGAVVVYVAVSVLFVKVPLRGAALVFVITCAVMAAVLRAFPRNSAGAAGSEHVSSREVVARMITVAVLVFLVTAIAPLLGPVPSGLLAAFPVYTGILAVFNHLKSSAQATAALRGVQTGAFGAAVFYVIVSLALGRLAIGPCFLLAALAGVAVQAALLPYVRRAASA